VANGDVLTDLDVAALVGFHRGRRAEATLHLIGVPDPSSFGVVAVDGDGRVERFIEKPAPGTAPSNLVNAGTYVLEPSVLSRIPAGQPTSIERATFPAVAADGGLFAMATDDYWIDTGRPATYLAANLDLLRGRRRHDRCEALHADAVVDPTAEVVDSIVGAGASIGAGARVSGSVVLPGASVGDGCVVADSVVMGAIGSGAAVHGSVIGRDGVVGPGERLHDARRPDPSA
jgi:mannose-1-phosphate guanylyltransferase